jgi:hypothetical protein
MMQYSEDEKKCIRIIAKWFRENKRIVNRFEAMEELGVHDDRYEVLMKMMAHHGIVEDVGSDLSDGYATHFQPSAHAEELAREFDEEEAKRADEGGAYGEGKYGEGPYGGEDGQGGKFKDASHTHDVFVKFLTEEKGYPSDSPKGEGRWQESGGLLYDIRLRNPRSGQLLAAIEVNQTNEGELYVREESELTEWADQLGVPVYVLVADTSDPNYEFGILRLSEKGNLEQIAIEDFPAYEYLKRKMEASEGDGADEVGLKGAVKGDPTAEASMDSGSEGGDSGNVFLENLTTFLVNEKDFPRESLNSDPLAGPYVDLAVTHPDTDSFLAIFNVKSGGHAADLREPAEILAKGNKVGSVGKHNPFVYMVHASEESNADFVISEVEDDGISYEISHGDFPTYKQLVFASPLSNKGRRICSALTRLAKDEHGLSVHAPCEDYIDLQIKRNGRTAAQVHRVNDSDENIALVLAGYQRHFPEAKLPTYMFEGEVKRLSGYTSKSQGERNWLEGNLGHPKLIYEAGVYVLRPGALVLDEMQNEVGELLELAKKNAEDDKEPEEIKLSKYGKGHIATIQMDRISDVDLLGRDKLVLAFSGMFTHTKEVEGLRLRYWETGAKAKAR